VPEDESLEEVLSRQCGVLTRAQALAVGLSDSAVKRRVQAGHWQRLFVGTYAAFSGPVPRGALLWAAVLHAGPGATLSHETAAELAGLMEQPLDVVHVTVPLNRRPRSAAGLVVHRSNYVATAVHPTRLPPRTRIDDTVADLVDASNTLDAAIDWITRACGRRLTTPTHLRTAFEQRPKLRWRDAVGAILADVADGCHSLLELRYLERVERAHGLPVGRRQATRRRAGGNTYEDVRHDEYGVVVELDGRMAHPTNKAWRDMRRDNASVERGDRVLRYGWPDVETRPCEAAVQLARVLQASGWLAAPRSCGRPGCLVGRLYRTPRRPKVSRHTERPRREPH
jgi:hypothetical protein